MSHHDMTRWIEDADARCVQLTAQSEHPEIAEQHYMDLGHAIANLSSWLHHGISREQLTAMGSHMLSHLRHWH